MNDKATHLRADWEKLPTQQLDEILQAELEKEDVDENAVRLILDILKEREQNQKPEINYDIFVAWEKYRARNQKSEKVSRTGWVFRAATLAVIFCMTVFVLPQAANADNVFAFFARWTDSVFEFFRPSSQIEEHPYVFETDNPGLQVLYDKMEELGATQPVVPMWLPEGYEMTELKVDEFPSSIKVYAKFAGSGEVIAFFYRIGIGKIPNSYAKNEEDAYVFECAGIEHYIMKNEGKLVVACLNENVEWYLQSDHGESITFAIVESIYTES